MTSPAAVQQRMYPCLYPAPHAPVLHPHNAYAATYLMSSSTVTPRQTVCRSYSAGISEAGSAHGQPKEVCGQTEEGTISGALLGRWAGGPSNGEDSCSRILSIVPRGKKEMRWFLGLDAYYCRFILNFEYLTSTLTDLTRKGSPVQCWVAFDHVK